MINARAPRATIADVARLAGVSEKSVSRVVNREPYVSARLKRKVEAAIAQLGYVPDPAARALAGQRSFTISIMLDTRGEHYAIRLIHGAYAACERLGYHLRVESLDSLAQDAVLLLRLQEKLRNGRLDGFVLTPPFVDNPAIMDFLDARQVRYTRVAPHVDLGRSPYACIDDVKAAGEVAELLVSKGHRRIGLINGPQEHGAAINRRRGFLEKLAQLGLELQVLEADGQFNFEKGIAAGRQLLASPDRPTAIFAANDDSAVGVMTACAQLGLRVPDDVSICGFDDSWAAKSVWPFLTTVHQPIAELAAEAVRLLIEPPEAGGAHGGVMLPHHIVERDSVRNFED